MACRSVLGVGGSDGVLVALSFVVAGLTVMLEILAVSVGPAIGCSGRVGGSSGDGAVHRGLIRYIGGSQSVHSLHGS